jgi:hypothetical protein
MSILADRIAKAGWPRRLLSMGIIIATFAMAAAAFVFVDEAVRDRTGRVPDYFEFAISGAVFLISLFGNSLLAWVTFDAQKAWRAVDYPWVLIAFGSVVLALTNMINAEEQQYFYRAKTSYVTELNSFYTELLKLPAHLCSNLDGLQESEKSACNSIAHTLGTIQTEVTAVLADDPSRIAEGQDWGGVLFSFGPVKYDPAQTSYPSPQLLPKSEWRSMESSLIHANASLRAYNSAQIGFSKHRGRWSSRGSTSIYFALWYMLLAFLVGLRLSRTTAELLQAREAERARRQP